MEWKKLPGKLFSYLFCGLALAFVITACDDDDNAVEPDPVAFVSLYQASPNAPQLDIVVDERQINTYPFDYSEYTGYLRFYTGDRNLMFGPYAASNVVEDTTVSFEEGEAYSVFVVDEYPEVDALVLHDVYNTPADGNAMVRFIHLSPDAPAVDLAVEGQTDVLYDNVEFKSPSEFMEVSADKYNLEVRAESDDEVLLTVPNVTFQEGWYYTFIVKGYTSPPAGNSNVLSADILVN